MQRKVAVVTDITSAGFWFPIWHKYYSDLFGSEALFVVSYGTASEYLSSFKLGGAVNVNREYSDEFRAVFMSDLVSGLLASHDVVLRADVDEFLIADPRRYATLASYIDEFQGEYITAFGFDVVQDTGEIDLKEDQLILVHQRKLAIINTALHKTAITTCNLKWGRGFHGCDRPPFFDTLYLAHMKFANVAARANWNSLMVGMVAPDSAESEYFINSDRDLRPQLTSFLERPQEASWNGLEIDVHTSEFLKTVYRQTLADGRQLFQGSFNHSPSTVLLPREFAGKL